MSNAAAAATLSIVIPAWNEEAGIGAIVTRTLAARSQIMAQSGVAGVEVIVVDDGSRDRTAEIARGFAEVRVISHPANRGYGAAIKTGFAEATGELLGFLDADGTCDPVFLAPSAPLFGTPAPTWWSALDSAPAPACHRCAGSAIGFSPV